MEDRNYSGLFGPPVWVLIATLMMAEGLWRPAAGAEPATEAGAATQEVAGQAKAPWRGSEFVYRNTVSINSLDRDAELTWNPYYAMTFGFQPRWWFSEHAWVKANLDLIRELTHPDDTTYTNEPLLGDLALAGGYDNLVTIPWVDVGVSVDLQLVLPTSKVSQARTLALGFGPGVTLEREFRVLGGLTLGYSLRASPLLHRMTTAERSTPLVPGCLAASGGCGPYLNTGERNPYLRLEQGFEITLEALDWLEAWAGFGLLMDWLHPITADDERISLQSQPDTDQRFSSYFEVELTFRPLEVLHIGLGYSTLSPQLAPDSSYYNPIFNRYSTLYLELRLEAEGLVSLVEQLVGKDD